MQIKDSIAFVTGANGGLGKCLVARLLDRGATRVYAAVRSASPSLDAVIALDPQRVVPVTFDITDGDQAVAAAAAASDVNLLFNNAGVISFGAPLDVDIDLVQRDVVTNYVGTLRTTRAFVPVLDASGGGTIVNIVTLIALAPVPGMSAYCASKAAAHSLTQALRSQLAARGIAVLGVYPGGMDTSMLAGVEVPKADPADVARATLDGVEAGSEDITPDQFSAQAYSIWRTDPKALERELAAF